MPHGKLIYLSLGSNLGDRAANLERAIAALPEAGVRALRRSSLYETEPVDFLAQPWFLNCVVESETSLMPRQLLHVLQGIERGFGSRKHVARGPRIIDLDILFYFLRRERDPHGGNGNPASAHGQTPIRSGASGRAGTRAASSRPRRNHCRIDRRRARQQRRPRLAAAAE